MPPRIKICGITSPHDAELALAAGADYLGLIFVDASPRSVGFDNAKAIVEAVNGQAQVVGVFQDSPVAWVYETATRLGLDFIQFHGGEPLEAIAAAPVPVIRAIPLSTSNPFDPKAFQNLPNLHALLFDRPKGFPDPEGWLPWATDFIAGREGLPPFFVAGGLTAENVAGVLQRTQADGVDVASGVEAAPGVKSPEALAAFCAAVRGVAR